MCVRVFYLEIKTVLRVGISFNSKGGRKKSNEEMSESLLQPSHPMSPMSASTCFSSGKLRRCNFYAIPHTHHVGTSVVLDVLRVILEVKEMLVELELCVTDTLVEVPQNRAVVCSGKNVKPMFSQLGVNRVFNFFQR